MERVLTKKEKKYHDQLAKSIFARKTKIFRRNVHLNHKETFLRILRIKTDDQFYDEVSGFKEIPRDLCFFIYHIDSRLNKDKYYSVYNSDYVITDSKTNKIISINEQPKNYPDFINVWIVRKNVASFLKLKINDILFTR